MRLVALFLLAVNTWATICNVPRPCSVITPDLTVLLAEVLETRMAEALPGGEWKLVPVRMKVKSLIFGKFPGNEFIWGHSVTSEVRAGDLFYIEESFPRDFHSTECSLSRRYEEEFHGPRIKFFQELAAGRHREASLELNAGELAGVEVSLAGPFGIRRGQTNDRGRFQWNGLDPGQYRLTAQKKDYSIAQPEEALAPVDLQPGSCNFRYFSMRSSFLLDGIVRTPDGKPAKGVRLRITRPSGDEVSTTTSGAEGHFTFLHLHPGEYVLIAGGDRYDPSPFPTSYYPGVPTRELSKRLIVGTGDIQAPIQFIVPDPVETRSVVIKIQGAPAGFRPLLVAAEGVVYDQVWSTSNSEISTSIPISQPLRFVVSGWHGILRNLYISREFAIEPGTATVQMTVTLSPSLPVSDPNPK